MKVEDIQREILRQNYQWPSYDGFITRCLTRYSIVSEKNGIPIYDMFTKPNTDDNRWICRGRQLAKELLVVPVYQLFSLQNIIYLFNDFSRNAFTPTWMC